jgi:hypothetical protein
MPPSFALGTAAAPRPDLVQLLAAIDERIERGSQNALSVIEDGDAVLFPGLVSTYVLQAEFELQAARDLLNTLRDRLGAS